MLDAQQNLFGKRIQPVEKWLKRYLKSGFVLRYERRKEIASDETIGTAETVQPFVLTPTLVSEPMLMHACKLNIAKLWELGLPISNLHLVIFL